MEEEKKEASADSLRDLRRDPDALSSCPFHAGSRDAGTMERVDRCPLGFGQHPLDEGSEAEIEEEEAKEEASWKDEYRRMHLSYWSAKMEERVDAEEGEEEDGKEWLLGIVQERTQAMFYFTAAMRVSYFQSSFHDRGCSFVSVLS